MRIEFDKMEGAGNDFILIDNRNGIVPDSAKLGLVGRYCPRCFGIGADGVIFVEKDPELDFAWDFYNSDGSRAEMCGNGARCVARYASKINAAGNTMKFRSLAGIIQADVTPRGAKVKLTDCAVPAVAETLEVDGKKIEFWLLNTGVPHTVIHAPELESIDVKGLGSRIRYHQRFAPAGTNVNFFKLGDGNRLSIRTYERGVEDETLACGTGSVATGIVAGMFFTKGSPITVQTKGGAELVIHFAISDCNAKDVYLEGGAKLVFSGYFEI